jgi:predicted transcriptional regulator YheO
MMKEILVLAGIMLTGNGLIAMILKRHWSKTDKIEKLCKLNNRMGNQLGVFSDTMENVLDVQDLLIDALHDKGVLNGNGAPIKEKLRAAKQSIHDYSKQIRDDSLLYKGEVV